jgi:hypothetical protein
MVTVIAGISLWRIVADPSQMIAWLGIFAIFAGSFVLTMTRARLIISDSEIVVKDIFGVASRTQRSAVASIHIDSYWIAF